jgi:hypothetical protein
MTDEVIDMLEKLRRLRFTDAAAAHHDLTVILTVVPDTAVVEEKFMAIHDMPTHAQVMLIQGEAGIVHGQGMERRIVGLQKASNLRPHPIWDLQRMTRSGSRK